MRIRLQLALTILASAIASRPSAGQSPERLNVLRFWPTTTSVHPLEPIVITFDHPVAPKLGETIDPARVVKLIPAAPAHMFWQDPSTIVVEFVRPWPFGSSYEVAIDPELHSASGLELAHGFTRQLWVRPARLIAMQGTERFGQSSTEQQPLAVYEATMPLARFAGRAWIVSGPDCPVRDSIPLTADAIRPIRADDAPWIRNARGDKRDTRLDTLRRVVRFKAARSLSRGCEFRLVLPPTEEEGKARSVITLRTPVPFRVDSIGLSASAPDRANVVVRFSVPVTEQQIRAGVTIDGKPPMGISPHYGDDPGRNWVFTDSVRPGRHADIVVRGDLRSANDERLGATVTRRIVAPHLPQGVDFSDGQLLVPRDAGALIALRHVNTDSVTIVIGRVSAANRAQALANRYGWFLQRDWHEIRSDTVVRTIATPAPIDSVMSRVIPASLIPAEWRNDPLLLVRPMPTVHGPWVVIGNDTIRVNKLPARDWYTSYAAVQRTNIAAHAASFHGKTDVWVTTLRSAEPVAGATVRVVGPRERILATGTTDVRGRVRLDYGETSARAEEQMMLEVTRDDDRLLLALPDDAPPAEVDDDAGGYAAQGAGPTAMSNGVLLYGTAFTERGIYRPGERVYLKGLARTAAPYRELATPAGDSARWSIFRLSERYERERVWRHLTRLTRFGTSADSFAIPRAAPLGEYQAILSLRDGRGWRAAAHAEFSVSEYRPAEFELSLGGDTVAPRFVGDTVRLQANANYLFGVPMTGGVLRWSANFLELDPWPITIPALEGYTQGRSGWRMMESERVDPKRTAVSLPDSATLDAHGMATVALPVAKVSSAAHMVVSVMAMDANRQVVTAERTFSVHPADAYVGVREPVRRWVHDVRDSIALELLVVHADGRRRVGTPITMIARQYRYVNGQVRADTVWRAEPRSAAEPVRVMFRAPAPGSYEVLATVRDERGRESTTGHDIWIAGDVAGSWHDPEAHIEIHPDRERYAPGDVATIVLNSPLEQRAWVTLSHSVPLDEQMVRLHPGPNAIQLTIPAAAMPKAQLRVFAVAPLGAGLAGRSWYFDVQTKDIAVSAAARQLDVRVRTDRDSYLPGDSVRVAVRVTDVGGRGRRAEATLWAVDEGVGHLTALGKPDVLSALLGTGFVQDWYGSSLVATVLSLSPGLWHTGLRGGDGMRLYAMGGYSSSYRPGVALEEVVVTGYGDQGGAAAAPLRRRFTTTPFFAGAIVTDSLGVAETRFKLPDNVTRYRVFATAVTAGTEAGSGDTTFVSTRPLVVRPALPRILRLGDTLLAGGVITQSSAAVTPVSLRVQTTGIVVSGSSRMLDTLRGQRSSELRFPMRVVSGDSVTVTLRGGSEKDGDAVRLTLPVSPPGHARAHVVSGMLEGRADVALPVVDGIDVAHSRVTVQLGSSLLPLARQTSELLRVYPYLCTEQVSSAGRALLARFDLERSLDPSVTLSARDRTQLETATRMLLERQQSQGGFGYWSRERWTSPWLTAYALEMLAGARAVGIDVPQSAIRRAGEYLKTSVAQGGAYGTWRTRDSTYYRHDALAVARALRHLGTPDTTLERELTAIRGTLSFVDRLDLAVLLAERGDSAEARALVNGAWKSARLSGRKVVLADSTFGDGWLFPSRMRPISHLIVATATVEPHHPLLGALIETFVERGGADTYFHWNTIDHGATAEVVVALRSAFGLGTARMVSVRGPEGPIGQAHFVQGRSDSLATSLAALVPNGRSDATPRLTLASDSNAPVYYAATVFEVPRARPVRADDEGISVERWYESYDDAKPIISVREGQLVRVRLRITVPTVRDFVAVEDPLPAGLEAVDLSLRTSSTLAPFAGAPKQPANSNVAPEGQWRYGQWDGGWWTPWEHREIRDDRVLYFARQLWKGTFEASYVARATTVGTFVRPPASAEEMYNPAVHGRSDGGVFTVTARNAAHEVSSGGSR